MHSKRNGSLPGRVRAARTWMVALALSAGACGDVYIGSNPDSNGGGNDAPAPTGGGGGTPAPTAGGGGNGNGNGNNTNTTTVNVGQIENTVSSGPARASVDVQNQQSSQQSQQSTQVADQVSIDTSQVDQDELVQGAVDWVDDHDDTLRLAVLAVLVRFDDHTRFVDASGREITREAFILYVKAELEAGRQPSVRCSRKPKKPPQAPHDRTFVAVTIDIQPTAVQPAIDCNIDRDHVVEQDGKVYIIVLDVTIVLVDGQTQIILANDSNPSAEDEQCLSLEGQVASVDMQASTLELADGTVVVVVASTQLTAADQEESDDDDQHEGTLLTSLAALRDALTAGETVRAEVTGCITGQSPTTVQASTLELEAETPRGS